MQVSLIIRFYCAHRLILLIYPPSNIPGCQELYKTQVQVQVQVQCALVQVSIVIMFECSGTLTKHDNMLRAMFSGRMEVLTDSDGWILIDRRFGRGGRGIYSCITSYLPEAFFSSSGFIHQSLLFVYPFLFQESVTIVVIHVNVNCKSN